MPRWVEECVESTKPKLRKKYPKDSDRKITSRAFAICQGLYKKRKKEMSKEVFHYYRKIETFSTMREALAFIDKRGGIVYGREEATKIMESEPLPSADGDTYHTGDHVGVVNYAISSTSTGFMESKPTEQTHFYIAGEAIHAITTRNMNTYLSEELRLAAPTLAGRTIQLDHSIKSIDTVGKVIVSSYDESSQSVNYVGRIQKDHPIARSVESGDIDTVSIGAYAKDVTCSICGESKVHSGCVHRVGREYDGEIATAIGRGLHFVELSVTPVPADPRASAGVMSHDSLESALVALAESYRGNTMSEEDKQPEIDTSEYEEEIKSLKATLGEFDARERLGLANRIAEAEVQLEERYNKDLDQRVKELTSEEKSALILLESSLRNRLKVQAPKPEAKGAIATITEEREPNQITVEEAKAWLREAVFGFPPPSPGSRRVVAKMRRSSEHPMAAEYAELYRGGNQ